MKIKYEMKQVKDKVKIEICLKSIDNNCYFIPIELIWEVNNYLTKLFDLYEYFEGTKNLINDINYKYKIGKFIPKYLCISKMDDDIFYKNTKLNIEYKENIEKLYDENKNIIHNFEEFQNIYLFEFQDIYYFATEDIEKMNKEIINNSKENIKDIIEIINKNSPISIDIYDGKEVVLYLDNKYADAILNIIKKY